MRIIILREKKKPRWFIVPSSRSSTCSLDQLKSCCARIRKKGWKKNGDCLKGKYDPLKILVCINNCYVKHQRVNSQALCVKQDNSFNLLMKLLKREAL